MGIANEESSLSEMFSSKIALVAKRSELPVFPIGKLSRLIRWMCLVISFDGSIIPQKYFDLIIRLSKKSKTRLTPPTFVIKFFGGCNGIW